MVLIYALPFVYILAGLIYAPIVLTVRTKNFLRFREGMRTGLLPEPEQFADPRHPGLETSHARGRALNQVFGILSSAGVLLSALALLPTLLSENYEYGGLALLGAFALLLFPGLAVIFDYPAIWDMHRALGENRGLYGRVPTVWIRVILMVATWIVGLVGSYWIAIAWIVAWIR